MQTIASLYNPDQLSQAELIDRFVVRLKTFQRLFNDIKESKMESAEQHILIEAQRGMGKTTMLLRLSYEIEQTPELNTWLVPIMFNEEQYSISRLFKLWEKIAEHLEETDINFIGLFDEMDALYHQLNDEQNYEKAAFDLLIQRLHDKSKKLILFIDNFGDMFKKFDKTETQRLRGILMTCPDIRIIAATSTIAESFFDYKEPLYEFFKIERLKGLNKKEAEELLLKLGESFSENPVVEILKTQPQRVETLRRLTGGIIRTMILLFEVFLDNKNGDAFSDLEKILDRVTPLYKHRMDDLPKQQQEIVHTIALEWDAISTKDIVAKTRLESKKVSAQLKQLIDNDIIEKIPTHNKNHLYAIKERFFNIWYLMRNGRKNDKQKVKWLVRFFESWCNGETLEKRVLLHIQKLETGNYNVKGAFYLTEALAGVKGISRDLQHQLLKTGRAFLDERDNILSESLSSSDKSLFEKGIRLIKDEKLDEAINVLLKIQNKNDFATNFIIGSNAYLVNKFEQSKKFLTDSLKSIDFEASTKDNSFPITIHIQLASIYKKEKNEVKVLIHLMKANEYATSRNRTEYSDTIQIGKIINAANELIGSMMTKISPVYKYNDYFKTSEGENLFNELIIKEDDSSIQLLFFIFFLNGEFKFLYYLLNSELGQKHNLKNRFKPHYYALMYFMQDKYPNEYLKMGSELKETVEEIIEEVKMMREKYQ